MIAPPPGNNCNSTSLPSTLRITYIDNDINSGACAVRNQAIMLAQGEDITGIDDDDGSDAQPPERLPRP